MCNEMCYINNITITITAAHNQSIPPTLEQLWQIAIGIYQDLVKLWLHGDICVKNGKTRIQTE